MAKGEKYMGYGDYAPNGGEKSWKDVIPFGGAETGNATIAHALTDKASSLSFTLGMARVTKEPDGTIVIRDKYDFSASKKKVQDLKDQGTWAILSKVAEGYLHNGLLGVGNVVGNLVAPDKGGRDVVIRIPPKK